MVRGNSWVVCIPDYGVYGRGGQWGGEEEVGLGSSGQAGAEAGLGIVMEALNFERRSLPGIGVGHLGSVRKEWENGASRSVQGRGSVIRGVDIKPSAPTAETWETLVFQEQAGIAE